MAGEKAISRARIHSLLLLGFAYVAWGIVESQVRPMWSLVEARRSFAGVIANDVREAYQDWVKSQEARPFPLPMVDGLLKVFEPPKLFDWKFEVDANDLSTEWEPLAYTRAPRIGDVKVECRQHVARRLERLSPRQEVRFRVSLSAGRRRSWQVCVDSVGDPNEYRDALLGVAAELGLKPGKTDKAEVLFRNIEDELLKKRIRVPSAGFECRTDRAAWIIAFLVVSLLVLMRWQLCAARDDRGPVAEESWVVVDGHAGLEGMLAWLWIGATLIAPWIALGCVVSMATMMAAIEGGAVSIWRKLLSFGLALGLMVVVVRASLDILCTLIYLRRVRKN